MDVLINGKIKKNIRSVNLGRQIKSSLFICDGITQGDEKGSMLVTPQNVNAETWIPCCDEIFVGGGSLGNSQTGAWGLYDSFSVLRRTKDNLHLPTVFLGGRGKEAAV